MMSVREFYQRLKRRGCVFQCQGDGRLVVSPKSLLSVQDCRDFQHLAPKLRRLIASELSGGARGPEPKPPTKARRRETSPLVKFSWSGTQVAVQQFVASRGRVYAGFFSLDCETEVVEFSKIPRLALVATSDGRNHYVIRPDDLGAFLLAHRDTRIVAHNMAFDFWVVHQHFLDRGELEALQIWIGLAKRRLLHDTMLLDMLLRLAAGGAKVLARDLAEVAHAYTSWTITKDDPYRLRYAEIIHANWNDVERGFFIYAVKDAIVTVRAYAKMLHRARNAMEAEGFHFTPKQGRRLPPDAVRRFGFLTEAIQVQAAVAFASVERLGLSTNGSQLARVRRDYEQRVNVAARKVHASFPDLFRIDAEGRFERTEKAGLVRRSDKSLETYLLAALKEINDDGETTIEAPRTAKGRISKSVKEWAPLAEKHPFLKLWSTYENIAKLKQFLANFDAGKIYPKYHVLMQTGRTSCSRPNLQQIPRKDEFREMIVPSPGHLLLIVDYKYIELVTLAAVCLTRFGASKLADVIREGVDPHCYTAALLRSMSYDDFLRLKERQPDEFKAWRQRAKPINFGVPGGMGSKALRDYAAKTYGVEMTLPQAENFRNRLIREVYPELGQFLADASMNSLARNLGVEPSELWSRLDVCGARSPAIPRSVYKIVAGAPFKADGEPYRETYCDRVWSALIQINRNGDLSAALAARYGSRQLADRLFFTHVATLSGRVRGGVNYSTERNTQFQGLAADGAKLAVARLVFNNFRVVGFIHDEILVELPDEGGYVRRGVVEAVVKHIRLGMQEVTCGVPVECEYALARCWSKRAKLIERGERILPWRPPANTEVTQDFQPRSSGPLGGFAGAAQSTTEARLSVTSAAGQSSDFARAPVA